MRFCPKCGSKEINIQVDFSTQAVIEFRKDDDFEVIERDDDTNQQVIWTENSDCSCVNCEWEGKVKDLQSTYGLVRVCLGNDGTVHFFKWNADTEDYEDDEMPPADAIVAITVGGCFAELACDDPNEDWSNWENTGGIRLNKI